LYGYNHDNSAHKISDDLDDVNFQQTVHYIGGSCVKSVIGFSNRYKNNEKWKRIFDVVKEQMLVGSLVDAPSDDVVAWTNARDRGGLKFISESVWSLLMALSGILTKNEESHGINLENVCQTFYSDEILMLSWMDIIQGKLDEEESKLLLNTFCDKYINAWGHGVTLRRKNTELNPTRGRTSLRSQLSR